MKAGNVVKSCFVWGGVLFFPSLVLANATATSGTPAAPGSGATVTVNTDAPNPYTIGIGSSSSADNLNVKVLVRAELAVSGSAAVNLQNSATVTNSGSITSDQTGIQGGNDGDFTNSGTITASSTGILGVNNNTLTNLGTIRSTGTQAVHFAADSTVVNTGILIGSNGFSLTFDSGTNQLTLGTGSQLTGRIVGGTGTDTLILQGTGSEDDIFQNFEVLNMTGSSWTLSGDSAITAINVLQGTLQNEGTLTGNVSVSPGAAIGGSGTWVGNVGNNGVLRPGNSIGTLAIAGALVQTSSSSLEIEIAGGHGDQVQITGSPGTATLAGAAQVIATGPDVSYAALTTTGGVTGTFDTVTSSNRIQPVVSYTALNVNVTTVSPATLDARTDLALQNGYVFLDSLSGRLHGLQGDALDEQRVQAAMMGPYQTDGWQEVGLWFRGLGQGGRRDRSEGILGSDYFLYGAALGMDRRLNEHVTWGGAFAATRGETDVEENAGGTSADSYMFGLYLGYENEHSPTSRSFLDVAVGGGINQFDHERTLFNQGSATTANARFDGSTWGARLAGGMDFRKGQTTLRPMAMVDYVHAHQDEARETGAGSANAVFAGHDAQALKAGVLLAVQRVFQVEQTTLVPEIRIGIEYEMALDDRRVETRIPGFGGAFTLQGNDEDETRGVLGMGGSWWFQDNASAFLDASGRFGQETQHYRLQGGMRILF